MFTYVYIFNQDSSYSLGGGGGKENTNGKPKGNFFYLLKDMTDSYLEDFDKK